MKPLISLGIGLSVVSGCLFLALLYQLHYLFWKKKKRGISRDIEENCNTSGSPAKELLYLFCWKKPSSVSSTVLHPQEDQTSVDAAAAYPDELLLPFGEDDTVEAELMRLHTLAGYPRLLFTIKEETKEDMEAEDGRRSTKASGGKSLRDLFHSSDASLLTPLSSPPFLTPPLTPLDCRKPSSGFNPLFESSKEEDFVRMWSSPPPKFKFLKDAEEKLLKKKLTEEANKVSAASQPPTESPEEDGSFITIVIGKGRDRGQQHYSSSSQVTPLPASPSSIKLSSKM